MARSVGPLVRRLVCWSVGRLVRWSVGRLVGSSFGRWSVGWSVGRLVRWSVGWFVGRLVRWSVGPSVGRFVGWVVGSLVGLLVRWSLVGGSVGQWLDQVDWSVGRSVGSPARRRRIASCAGAMAGCTATSPTSRRPTPAESQLEGRGPRLSGWPSAQLGWLVVSQGAGGSEFAGKNGAQEFWKNMVVENSPLFYWQKTFGQLFRDV